MAILEHLSHPRPGLSCSVSLVYWDTLTHVDVAECIGSSPAWDYLSKYVLGCDSKNSRNVKVFLDS